MTHEHAHVIVTRDLLTRGLSRPHPLCDRGCDPTQEYYTIPHYLRIRASANSTSTRKDRKHAANLKQVTG